MGCGGYSKVHKPDVNGAVYRKITKEEVRIESGDQVKICDDGPIIVFVYGGPGSKKGRLVSELVEVFDFTFVNVEKIMLQKLSGVAEETISTNDGRGDEATSPDSQTEGKQSKEGGGRKESLQELKKMLEDDPTAISLNWILHEVALQVDQNPKGRYLVDMMPNLKYIMRTANFSHDCSSSMKEFESKLPISFCLYFSMNMGPKKTNKVEVVEVKEENEEEAAAGFQSDEVDLSRTKRRASMFENSVRPFLDYFQQSERLMSVDISSRNCEAISSRVCELLCSLNLRNMKLVNTVLIFVFDSKGIDPEELIDHDIEYINLDGEGTKLSISNLDNAIKSFVNKLNHKEHKTFVVDLSSTNIDKTTSAEVLKSSVVFVNEANSDHRYSFPGCSGLFKTVSSLENVICVFPLDTSSSLCKKIALAFNKEFGNPRHAVVHG